MEQVKLQDKLVDSMKIQMKKFKAQLLDLESRLLSVESTLKNQSCSTDQVASIGQNQKTDCRQQGSEGILAVKRGNVRSCKSCSTVSLNKSTLRSLSFKAMRHLINLVNVTHITDATVLFSHAQPTSLDFGTTQQASSKALTKRTPTTASQLMKSPLIPTPKSINVNSTVSHKVKQQAVYSLRKISSTSSAKFFINRFSGWATDGKAGHSPPSTEMIPAKLLETLKEFKGYRWYWFRDRWLLFTLHEE
ncbi:hypothetical protein BY996DRAFT_6424307 [Phakopsora pachyrhizi]|nr:hypothetical protein BY996DRAFT_6424307 [Phakopsora pachyrhizi]